jgi:hypothetical protein
MWDFVLVIYGMEHLKGEAKSRGMGFSLVGGSVLREVLVFSDLRG